MMFHRLKSIHKNQKGFTLIELIVALAITALIIGAIVMSIFQVFIVNALSSNHMLAVRQVQNAGYWINRDVQMAQSVATDAGATGFPLDVTWEEWDGTLNEVTYTLEDGEIKRSHSVNGGGPSVIVVAQYINSAETSCGLTGGGTFTLPDKDDAFTITGGAVADSGIITVDTDAGSIKVTTNGGATYNAPAWTTTDANDTVVVTANEDITAGVWTSTTAKAKVAITTDIDDENATITGDKLILTVTATVGTWPQVENETRVYEIVPRPDQ